MKLLSLMFLVASVAAAQSAPPQILLPPPPGFTTPVPTQRAAPPQTTTQTSPPRKGIPAIAKAANGAVVSIIMSDKDGKPIAQGSGFLVSRDGVIVTNYHVISECSSAVVKLPDGAFFVVDGVLASDKARDVAIIKAHGENFRTLPLGNSDRLQVGEDVVAIGSPLSLESSVSSGIVSGFRTAEELGGKFLQVTAAISPGSSGGPLFNMAGEVVGITTLIFTRGQNVNFVIPINDVKRLLVNQSANLQNLPNEVSQEKPTEPRSVTPETNPKTEEKTWTSDLLGGEFKVEIERSDIRITTVRPPNKAVCDFYHISQENFTHDLFLDVKDANGDLVGPLDAHLEFMKDGKPTVATLAGLELHAVSDSQLIGWFMAIDNTGALKSTRITFSTKELLNELSKPSTPTIFVFAPDQIPPELVQDTLGELLETIKYCYSRPSDSVQLVDGSVQTCKEVNAARDEFATKCKSAPKDIAKGCERLNEAMNALKTGHL